MRGRRRSIRIGRRISLGGICLFLAFSQLSCGIDYFPFISPVPGPRSDLNGTVFFTLPSTGDEGYGDVEAFTNFVIYYRIYLSDFSVPTNTVDTGSNQQLRDVNPQLAADFAAIYPWADHSNINVTTSNVHNFFVNTRGFLSIEIEGANIAGVLGRDSLGQDMRIDFQDTPGRAPMLNLAGSGYQLRRSQRSERVDFDPLPNLDGRLPFFNHPALLSRDNRTDAINADVVDKTNIQQQDLQHSYAIMYIAAAGLSSTTPPTRVFSQPTFLGIFRLPSP